MTAPIHKDKNDSYLLKKNINLFIYFENDPILSAIKKYEKISNIPRSTQICDGHKFSWIFFFLL